MSYESDIDSFLNNTSIEDVRTFVINQVEESINNGVIKSKERLNLKTTTWVTSIVNQFFIEGKESENFTERCQIIEETGFVPKSNFKYLNSVDKNKFKSIGNLFEGEKSKGSTCKLAIAIFDIKIENYSETNHQEQSEISVNDKSKKSKMYYSVGFFAFVFIILIFHFIYKKTNSKNHYLLNKIYASSLLSTPIEIQKTNTRNLILYASKPFVWKSQEGTNISLDSMIVRLKFRNSSNFSFYFDRLVLHTYQKSILEPMSIIENDLINSNPNMSITLNSKKTNWNYVFKIIKDDKTKSIPANSEVSMLLLVKGDNSWDNEKISFKFFIDGHSKNKSLQVESNKIYELGFR